MQGLSSEQEITPVPSIVANRSLFQRNVLHIRVEFPQEWRKAKLSVWYQRVRDWCKRNKIVLRTPNKTVPTDPRLVAQDVLECTEELTSFLQGRNVDPAHIWSFDEKSFGIFSHWLNMQTLDHQGAKVVFKNKKNCCKMCLSAGVCWSAAGDIRIVIVYNGSDTDPEYEDLNGIIWLNGNTKWTRKDSYVKILRAVLTLGTCAVPGHKTNCFLFPAFSHDRAPSHNGPAPGHFLRSLGVEKILPIPPNATWALQPADNNSMNGRLSLTFGDVMGERDLKLLLSNEFEKKGFTSLSRKARQMCSEVLAEVMKRMQTPESREAIRRGWRQTLLGSFEEKTSDLKILLEQGKKLPKRRKSPKGKFPCPHGCGEMFRTKLNRGTMRYKKHLKSCWFCRKELLAPVTEITADRLNEEVTSELGATILSLKGPRARPKNIQFKQNRKGKVVAKHTETGRQMEDDWWCSYDIEYWQKGE